MGLIRKSLSLSTAGMVDFRSDKERIARSTRITARNTGRLAKAARVEVVTITEPTTPGAVVDVAQQVKELTRLRDSGELSSWEFTRAKARLLGEGIGRIVRESRS
ncbi:MAG: SHOCT domain-containing protein [Pseudonocardiaceae bacterium]